MKTENRREDVFKELCGHRMRSCFVTCSSASGALTCTPLDLFRTQKNQQNTHSDLNFVNLHLEHLLELRLISMAGQHLGISRALAQSFSELRTSNHSVWQHLYNQRQGQLDAAGIEEAQ